MKKFLLLIAVASVYAFNFAPETYVADVTQSNVHWLGKKTTGSHEGNVNLQSGKISFSNSLPVNGEFVLNMNTITVTDITDSEDNQSLLNHLKADDFFGVAKYPTAQLTIKKFDEVKGGEKDDPNYMVIADLTIKGITNEIRFPATMIAEGDKATAKADITIDRTKWNISYKSKSILGSTADKFIYDEINFSVNVVLKRP